MRNALFQTLETYMSLYKNPNNCETETDSTSLVLSLLFRCSSTGCGDAAKAKTRHHTTINVQQTEAKHTATTEAKAKHHHTTHTDRRQCDHSCAN